MNNEEIKFTFDVKSLDKFRKSLTNLGKINKVIKIKFKGDKMIMYALEESGNITLAFKCHTYLIKDFFHIIEDDLTKEDSFTGEFDDGMSDGEEDVLEFDWIIGDVKLFYNKLSFFGQKDMGGKFTISERNDVKQVSKIEISDGRYNFSLFSSEAHIVRDITLDQLNKLLDTEASDLKISFSTEEFNSSKKACTIDSEDVVCILLEKDRIKIKQSSWALLVGQLEEKMNTKSYCFHKKFLKSINPIESEMNIWCFRTFVLFQEHNEKFMISYEQEY